MYEKNLFIKLLKEIANDENFNENQRELVRDAIRCTAKFMLYDVALMGYSIAEATYEIEEMFPSRMKSTETENIVETAFNDAEIALTTICENIGDEKIASKIRKMRDDLRKIMTSC